MIHAPAFVIARMRATGAEDLAARCTHSPTRSCREINDAELSGQLRAFPVHPDGPEARE